MKNVIPVGRLVKISLSSETISLLNHTNTDKWMFYELLSGGFDGSDNFYVLLKHFDTNIGMILDSKIDRSINEIYYKILIKDQYYWFDDFAHNFKEME